MIEVIGVKFKSGGKMYYFAPGDFNPAEGSYVVVETARGQECGEVAARRHAVQDDSITAPLKPIIRLANAEDLEQLERNRAYMADAFRVCQERIDARSLPMRLVDVEVGFDSNKLIFYFTAESRVDFRELVKDLANAFHVRIELRQIGDRDEAKLLGGLGICGREFCCKGYLSNFQPISIKMAKEQGLALNPSKISGACGRLMCCLRYESPVYEELIKLTPKTGSTVLLPGEPPVRAYVMEANLVTGNLRVKPENSDMPITVHRDSVERLTDTSRRMTKEDLRDRRGAAARPAAGSGKPQPAAQNPAEGGKEKEQKPAAPHKQQKPRPQKQQAQRPENEQKQHPQTAPAQKSAAEHPQPAAESARAAAHTQPAAPQNQPAASLYEEFGETRKSRPQTPAPAPQKPLRPAAPADDFLDFTEHRAAVEHPERAAEQQAAAPRKEHPQHREGGNRRPYQNRRGQQNNRRPHDHNRPNGGNPSAQKPEGDQANS